MNMILGYVMTFLGFSGTFYFWSYIKHDYWYTYTAPFTSHETTVLTLLVFSIFALIAGIGIIIDALKCKSNGQPKNVCPNCGLNVTDNCSTCPACGHRFEKGEGK